MQIQTAFFYKAYRFVGTAHMTYDALRFSYLHAAIDRIQYGIDPN